MDQRLQFRPATGETIPGTDLIAYPHEAVALNVFEAIVGSEVAEPVGGTLYMPEDGLFDVLPVTISTREPDEEGVATVDESIGEFIARAHPELSLSEAIGVGALVGVLFERRRQEIAELAEQDFPEGSGVPLKIAVHLYTATLNRQIRDGDVHVITADHE